MDSFFCVIKAPLEVRQDFETSLVVAVQSLVVHGHSHDASLPSLLRGEEKRFIQEKLPF